MSLKNYENGVTPTSLTGNASDVATTINVAATAGFPSVPFTIGVDRGTPDEEAMLVTAVGATTMTVTRGYDGTTAVAHLLGAAVEHCAIAEDYNDANSHIFNTALDHHTQYLTLARAAVYHPKVFSGTSAQAKIPTTSYSQCNAVLVPSAAFSRKVQLSAQVMVTGDADAVYICRISLDADSKGNGQWHCLNALMTNTITFFTDWMTIAAGSAYTYLLEIRRTSGTGGLTSDDSNYNKITANVVPNV